MSTDASAVVLSCRGGEQGSLGLVRSLGRAGIRVTLLTENPTDHALASKYTTRAVHVESFKNDPDEVVTQLLNLAKQEPVPPVIFPSSDPDLELISERRDELEGHYLFTTPSPAVVTTCLDKGRFFEFALEREFPIAKTRIPKTLDDLDGVADEFDFPVILKPLHPSSWMQPEIRQLVERKKAVVVEDEHDLRELFGRIAELGSEVVVQEYIPGRDDALQSVHVCMSSAGEPLGWFVGRKIRTYPAFAGIGCSVVSESNQALVDTSVDILQRSGYQGVALLQYKQHAVSGCHVLLEINARASSWNHLATECGVNIPELAYQDATGGEIDAPPPQRDDVTYVFLKPDVLALPEYLESKDWTVTEWLLSFRGRRVHQLLSRDDPRPFLRVAWRDVRALTRKLARSIRR